LLKEFDGSTRKEGREGTLPTPQKQIASSAGISEHQRKQAVGVAHVPADKFEAAVDAKKPAPFPMLIAAPAAWRLTKSVSRAGSARKPLPRGCHSHPCIAAMACSAATLAAPKLSAVPVARRVSRFGPEDLPAAVGTSAMVGTKFKHA
jgi:hypothetical protein